MSKLEVNIDKESGVISVFNDGESVVFSASVSDQETSSDSLLIEWSSDLDGVVGTASAVNGVASLTTDALSVGSHTVTLTVTDAPGTSAVDSVMVNVNGVCDHEYAHAHAYAHACGY